MTFTKMKLMLAAVAVAGLAACDPGTTAPLTCSSNTDCDAATEICHPDAKLCVQTCEAAADCSTSQRNCAALGGTSADKDKKICKCQTDALCNSDGQTDQVCNTAYELCQTKCTANTDCPTGYACETTSGQCRVSAPACTTDATCTGGLKCDTAAGRCRTRCTANAECATGFQCETSSGQCRATGAACTLGSCAAGQVCNLASSTCAAAATCSGSSQSTCSYGQFCSSGSCRDAPLAPTACENFSGSNRPQFNSSSNGPVIYSVARREYQVNSSYCRSSAPDAFIITVRAYRPDSNWPSTRAEVAGFFYVRTDTTQLDVVNEGLLVPNTGYNRNDSNLKDAEFNVYLCRPSNSTSLQVGFYFTGGNPVCANIAGQ
jgi:hypothetical protein